MEILNIYNHMYAEYIHTLHARTFPLQLITVLFSVMTTVKTVQCKECQHFGGGRERWGGGGGGGGEGGGGRRGREKIEDILDSILSRFH